MFSVVHSVVGREVTGRKDGVLLATGACVDVWFIALGHHVVLKNVLISLPSNQHTCLG